MQALKGANDHRMLNAMSRNDRERLVRNLAGTIAVSLVMSTLYTLFGYGDVGGATLPRFLEQLMAVFLAYALAALLTQLTPSQEKLLHDVYCISFLGSGISYLVKLVVLDSSSGIPWLINAVSNERTIRPIIFILSRWLSFTLIIGLISFPFVAAGLWLWTAWNKGSSSANAGPG